MSNPSKSKGTAGEVAVLKWARANGFPWAERLALAGVNDCGDISLVPGRAVTLEIKNYRGAPGAGQPAAGLLEGWLKQADAERVNAGADFCPLVVKRSGTADVGRWFAYMRLQDFLRLLGAPISPPNGQDPICTSVASLNAVLRASGYGSAHEEETR